MRYEQVRYEVDGPVATVTLNRPDALNAWTGAMGNEVADAVGRAEGDDSVVGIVLTGAGRGFCAGADINDLAAVSASGRRAAGAGDGGTGAEPSDLLTAPAELPGDPDAGDDLRGTYTYFMSLAKPVVAAINGAVAGMGVPIALACDLRFMSTEAVLTTSFSKRGLIAEWGLAWQLNRLVGPAIALDLLFSARKVGGDEAAAMGLVNRALPPDEVLPAAQSYVADLAEHASPTSLAVIKRQVYDDLGRGLGEAQAAASSLMLESLGRPDFAEGVASFVERRAPDFPPLPAQRPNLR